MSNLKNQTKKESFASRWSRRKQQQKREPNEGEATADGSVDEVTVVTPNNTESSSVMQQSAEQRRAEKLAELNALKDQDMPEISTLNENSDFAQFMSENVSEGLRKLALRKLFHGKGYNVRDGLDEYDGDYTYFEKLDPNIITADMKHRLELEAEKLKAQLEDKGTEKIKIPANDDASLRENSNEIPDETAEIEEKDTRATDADGQHMEHQEQHNKQMETEQDSEQITTELSGDKQT